MFSAIAATVTGILMNILVTGGAGYIGSHTVKLLATAATTSGSTTTCRSAIARAVPAERLIVGDLAEVASARSGPRRATASRPSCTSPPSPTSASRSQHPAKYYQNNLVNTLTLLEAMRRHGVKRIVFSSTCATYGVPERVPITEETAAAADQSLRQHQAGRRDGPGRLSPPAYGWGFAALRYFNASGASPDGDIGEDHDPETHLIPLVLQAAARPADHIDVFGTDYPTPDGTCIRDYIHVDDLADAHLSALERLQPGGELKLNLGTGPAQRPRGDRDSSER